VLWSSTCTGWALSVVSAAMRCIAGWSHRSLLFVRRWGAGCGARVWLAVSVYRPVLRGLRLTLCLRLAARACLPCMPRCPRVRVATKPSGVSKSGKKGERATHHWRMHGSLRSRWMLGRPPAWRVEGTAQVRCSTQPAVSKQEGFDATYLYHWNARRLDR